MEFDLTEEKKEEIVYNAIKQLLAKRLLTKLDKDEQTKQAFKKASSIKVTYNLIVEEDIIQVIKDAIEETIDQLKLVAIDKWEEGI